MGAAAAIIALTAASATYQGVSANQQAKKQEGIRNQEKDKQEQLIKDKKTKEGLEAQRASEIARRGLLSASRGTPGRGGTILTSPLGIQGQGASSAPKMKLGA